MTTDTLTAAALEPGTPGWLRLMTASKVAAVLGVSKYDSPRSLWHKMRNELPEQAQTKVQSRGHFLEPAVLAWWLDQHDHNSDRLVRQPVFLLGDWAAATPDAVTDDASVLVEAKSARDDEHWGPAGTDEVPAEYLVQAYWQMHVSGIHECRIPMIGPWLEFAEYVVKYDTTIGAELERRCRAFWDSLHDDQPPALDDSKPTYDALRQLHRAIDADKVVELSPALAREYIEAKAAEKSAAARCRAASAAVLEQMTDARYGDCGGVRVARRQPNKTGFQLNQVATTTDSLPPAAPSPWDDTTEGTDR